MLAGVQEWVPSAVPSFVAVTVTVCGVVKFAEVKLSVVGENEHCGLVPIVTVTAELPAGGLTGRTVKDAVSPPSVAELSDTTTSSAERPHRKVNPPCALF